MIRAGRLSGGVMVAGHAGLAPRGQDLVCAAVSILTETLGAVLPPEASQMEDGFAAFHFTEPCPEAEFACSGLKLLEKAYPSCVCFQDKRR